MNKLTAWGEGRKYRKQSGRRNETEYPGEGHGWLTKWKGAHHTATFLLVYCTDYAKNLCYTLSRKLNIWLGKGHGSVAENLLCNFNPWHLWIGLGEIAVWNSGQLLPVNIDNTKSWINDLTPILLSTSRMANRKRSRMTPQVWNTAYRTELDTAMHRAEILQNKGSDFFF